MGDIVYLTLEGFIYFGLIFLVEYLLTKGSITTLFTNETSIQYKEKIKDQDVMNEEKECAIAKPEDYAVLVQDLRKVYPTETGGFKVAVDKVSFKIPQGECFALLGVNGAGKTTTFKILAGEINQTQGNAFIKGYNVATDLNQARMFMGYCPQFDALLDNVTVREHLELFAAIKGLPVAITEQLVKKKVKEMQLTKFENICAGTLSGGNKRKLQVAIATLGNPPVIFLDEPSTGMDPEARRFMWNVISRISTQRK